MKEARVVGWWEGKRGGVKRWGRIRESRNCGGWVKSNGRGLRLIFVHWRGWEKCESKVKGG